MKLSGENLPEGAVCELLAVLDANALRRVTYAVLDEVLCGHTVRVVEMPRVGSQKEMIE